VFEDIIFRSELDALEKLHPDHLNVIHTLTRESDAAARGPNFRSGRIHLALLKESVPEIANCHFFVCGPAASAAERAFAREKGVEPQPRFLESVLADLKTLEVPRDRITYESYG